MSEGLEVFLLFLGMIYFGGIMFWAVTTDVGDKLLAPAWPLFWLKYVWRRLRE